jgi:hypothetical protein
MCCLLFLVELINSLSFFRYDEKTFKLYFAFNGTEPPSGSLEFVATHTETEVLFNVTGSKANPVIGFTIAGVEIRDAAVSFDFFILSHN